MTTVSIVKGDPDLCRQLKEALNNEKDIRCISFYTSCNAAIKCIPKDKPGIILTGLVFPSGMSGMDFIQQIRDKMPGLKIIVISSVDDGRAISDSIRYEAQGYLSGNVSIPSVITAIRNTGLNLVSMTQTAAKNLGSVKNLRHKPPLPNLLSKRNLVVLRYLCMGYTYEQIAEMLCIQRSTVKKHMHAIFCALHVTKGTLAVRKAIEDGWV